MINGAISVSIFFNIKINNALIETSDWGVIVEIFAKKIGLSTCRKSLLIFIFYLE